MVRSKNAFGTPRVTSLVNSLSVAQEEEREERREQERRQRRRRREERLAQLVLHERVAELGGALAHFGMEVEPPEEGELRLERGEHPVDQHPPALEVAKKGFLARDRLRREPRQERDEDQHDQHCHAARDDRGGRLARDALEREPAHQRE